MPPFAMPSLIRFSSLLAAFVALEALAQVAPSSNDLWDVSQGVVVFNHSPLNASGSDANDMLGAQLSPYVPERGNVVFTDNVPDNFVHFVDWKTRDPVTIRSFNLFAWGDGYPDRPEATSREFAEFTLKAKSLGSATFDLTVYQFVPKHPYEYLDTQYPLLLSANIPAVRAQEFRAEFANLPGRPDLVGPRIVELDGFAEPRPPVIDGPAVNPQNGHAYYLTSRANWRDSEEVAVSLGGHLATINDEAEQQWVVGRFSNALGESRNFWIGLTDAAKEGVHTWVNGEPAGYRNWAPGEPNNCCGGENYVVMYGLANAAVGGWNDEAFTHLAYGLVEVAPPDLSAATGVELFFATKSGQSYQLQTRDSLTVGSWADQGGAIPGTGGEVSVFVSSRAKAARYFRLTQLN